MTDSQRVLMRLLAEFGRLCEDNGITWCAADRLAWGAYKHNRFLDSTFDAYVMVTRQGMDALLALPAGALPANRHFYEHASEDGTRLRYVADDSANIFLPFLHRACDALCLCIRCLEPQEGGTFRTTDPNGKAIDFDLDLTATALWARFEDQVIPLPASPDAYFKAIAGGGWRTCDYPGPVRKPSTGFVMSGSVGAKDVMGSLEEDGFAKDEMRAFMDDYARFWDKDYNAVAGAYAKQMVMPNVNTQRMRLCHKYLPFKDQLLSAWKAGRKEPVIAALNEDYLKEMRKYYNKHGIALHFDDELFDLAVEALKAKNWAKADKLAAAVPPRHREQPLSAIMAPYLR